MLFIIKNIVIITAINQDHNLVSSPSSQAIID